MAGTFLLRGMLVGIIAGLLCFSFLKVVGEPQVNRAIAFETQLDEAKAEAAAQALIAQGLAAPKEEPEPELVSRGVQAGIGLFIGVMIYNIAFGGLFALAFALAYGRMGDFGPRSTAALMAILGLIAVYVVPNLKYPANPPSVGDPATIGPRTALYFSMIAISLAAMIAAGMLRLRLLPRYGAWNAFLIAATAYLLVVIVVGLALPAVNEVPEGFPAVVLWQFRVASLGAQVIMWITIGLVFGAVTERAQQRAESRSVTPGPPRAPGRPGRVGSPSGMYQTDGPQLLFSIAPAEAGAQACKRSVGPPWVPAFAGMTITACGYHLLESDH